MAQPGRQLLAESFRKGWEVKHADLDRDGAPEPGTPRFRMQAAMQHYVDHIDNVPVMFAVLQMGPEMSHGQWLLVTLTAGVGGSLLSIGSAAGVALMGQARGIYTFGSHLRWLWAIALGYAASILTHLWLNARMF